MNINFSRLLLILFVTTCPAFAQAADPIYYSTTYPILFEIIENGVVTNRHVSLQLTANKKDGAQWAECLITMITGDSKNKRMELSAYYTSTDQETIRNLSITPKAISFDMMPFPLAPDRPLRFIATREHEASYSYQANGVGLWKGLFKEIEMVKTEWKQVPSITLPYTTIGK